jgi:large subunit ribosomal protein L17
MRHKKLNKRFGRNKSQRKQLMRSLARSLFTSYSIETTAQKAKEAKKMADNIITYAKSGTLNDIREIERILQDRALVAKIMKIIPSLGKDRKGGHTRVIRNGFRRGDGADLAILQLTDMPVKDAKQQKPKKAKTKSYDEQASEDVQPKHVAAKQVEQAAKKDSPKTEKSDLKEPVSTLPKKQEPAKIKDAKKPKADKKPQGKKDVLGRFRKFFRNKSQ